MPNSPYRVTYNIEHGYRVLEFLEAYGLMLRRAIDEIWDRIGWVEKFGGSGERRSFRSYPKMERSRTII